MNFLPINQKCIKREIVCYFIYIFVPPVQFNVIFRCFCEPNWKTAHDVLSRAAWKLGSVGYVDFEKI